jgi:hypothetical protein
MASSRDVTSRLRERVWNGSIALEIRLHKGDCRTYDDSDSYLVCLLYLNSEFEFEFEQPKSTMTLDTIPTTFLSGAAGTSTPRLLRSKPHIPGHSTLRPLA